MSEAFNCMRQVEWEIRREAKRLIIRHERRAQMVDEEKVRRTRRSMAPVAPPKLERPAQWGLDAGFDPYLTRSRANRIAHSVRGALLEGSYTPKRPCSFELPKPGGGKRTVCVYQVADSAVSKMVFEELLRKNLPLLSARSYAYRQDVTTQDAIHYVKAELLSRSRVFVAEYDFRAFFDTIAHDHIQRILRERFFVSGIERVVIEKFLTTPASPQSNYQPRGGAPSLRGIPQGTSVSLFLANVAAWELDRELERVGVGFVRYADDTLIWSTDYGRLCAAAETLHSQAPVIGVEVNDSKSPGIRLLAPKGVQGELETTDAVDYLGYRLRSDGVFLKPSAESKIKRRVQQIIYNNLLRAPQGGEQHLDRVGKTVDRDYVTTIWQLRRYLYGDLTEKSLRRYRRRSFALPQFKGVMSAYPLIDDTAELKRLDKWILDRLWLAVRRRGDLLTTAGLVTLPAPHGLTRAELRSCSVRSSRSGQTIDLRVPSVRRIARAVVEDTAEHGPGGSSRAPRI